jgi:hypothetical protein
MRKTYSMPEKYVNYIKTKAEKLEIAESDVLRRIIDQHIEQEKKEMYK